MPIQNCPIEIPDGWEFVRYGVPDRGETFLNEDGEPDGSEAGCVAPWVIIRRARPKLKVGDWVRVVHLGGHTDGKRGVVSGIPGNEGGGYLVDLKGVGSLHYQREHIIKQDRKIEPYTMDQCLAEIAKRGSRAVESAGLGYLIMTISAHGFYTEAAFYTYGEAAERVTWPNGDAFGIVKWEDAE